MFGTEERVENVVSSHWGESMNNFDFVLFSAFMVLLSGCAGGKYYESSNTIEPTAFVSTDQARASLDNATSRIIAIRWPAVISAQARGKVVENDLSWYKIWTDGHDSPNGPFQALPDLIESSSTLFASELYWGIRRVDPSVVVLLEPQIVTAEKSGQLILKPLVDPAIPVDIIADLWVTTVSWAALVSYSFDFMLQAAPARSPGNCGLLLTTIGHEPLPSAFEKTPCKSPNVRNALQSHVLLDGQGRADSMPAVRHKQALPLTKTETVQLKSYGYSDGGLAATMNDYVKASRPVKLADAETTPIEPAIKNYANIAVSALSVIDPVDTAPHTLASYVQELDPPLAEKIRVASQLSSTEERNLRLIRKLLAAEVQVRAKRDEQIAREILAGEFGRKVRESRDKAYPAYNANMAKQLAAGLTSLATTYSAGGVTTFANMQAYQAQLDNIGKEYTETIAPSVTAMGTATVNVLDGVITVDANDQEALRAAVKKLYLKQRRLLEPGASPPAVNKPKRKRHR